MNLIRTMRCRGALLTLSVCATTAFAQDPGSPAEQKIAAARRAIEARPDHVEAYNDLAIALARRARETSNPTFYDQAEQALAQSFRLSPDNFDGQKARVWILLGKHEFARALEEAKALNEKVPDDLMVYGYLTDANVELGNYEAAEDAAQWMLDLRPGNVPALTRAAYLRELFGDIEGALDLMHTAYHRMAPTETEDRAWILTQMAHLELMSGQVDHAEKLSEAALALFPEYHYAQAGLARIRLAQQRYADAVTLLRAHFKVAPHPENQYRLAEALERAGRLEEAGTAFAEFETRARAEMRAADNSNRELIFYYTDHASNPPEALRLAREEIAHRRDVYTLDAFAWALQANEQYAEARKQIDTALTVGIRDATIFYHAGIIASKVDDHAAAARHLRASLTLWPSSEVSDQARKVLSQLTPPSEAGASEPDTSG